MDSRRSPRAGDHGSASRTASWWSGLLLAFAVGWLGLFFAYPWALAKLGVGHYRVEIEPNKFHEVWFLDTHAILASNDALAAGHDPYATNRLDYFGRPHVYGPSWLLLRHFGLTRFHTLPVGLGLGLAFVVMASVFLRPRDPRSLLWYIAILCAPPVLAAIERGNNDLVIFLLLAPVVWCILAQKFAVRWLAIPLVALAAELKFYPAAAAFLLVAHPSQREIGWRTAAALIALGIAAAHVLASPPDFGSIPSPHGILSLGATRLFYDLGFNGRWPPFVVLGVALAAVLLWSRSRFFESWRPPASSRSMRMHCLLGGILLTACFFVGTHFAYRWIFAVWMAPLFWSLPRDPDAPVAMRKLGGVLRWLLLALLWTEPLAILAFQPWPHDTLIRATTWISLGLQPLAWIFFLCLVGLLLKLIRLEWAEWRAVVLPPSIAV